VERIRQKIGRINEHLSIIRSIKDDCSARFATDPVYRGALLHYLYLLSDSCIMLAELVIKHKGLRIPQSYAESFDILGENHVLDADFAYRFTSIAGFERMSESQAHRFTPSMWDRSNQGGRVWPKLKKPAFALNLIK
jgi:uncharacterized protein YutE (UPF0331/DUF86 family)